MPTRAQLAQRRALVAAASKRHPPRPVPPAQLPRPTAYTKALTTVADELNAEIAAALMGMDYEPVLAEVKKTTRIAARTGTTRVFAGEQGAQRAVVVERRVIRKRVAT